MKLLKSFFLAALIMICPACKDTEIPAPDPVRDPDPDGLKIMSFNVRYSNTSDSGSKMWSRRIYGVSEMLRVERPMIMGVQECLMSQRKDILNMRPEYGAVGVGREDGREKGETMSIFYLKDSLSIEDWGTYWLSETPDVPSKGWDAACYRTATWARVRIKASGEEFFYTNTHLDHKGARKEEIGVIESKMAELNQTGLPMVLTADFNTSQSDAIFNGLYKYMNNARIVAPQTDSWTTYQSFGETDYSIIDHIFFSSGLTAVKYKTVIQPWLNMDYISDHYPIFAVFEFNNKQ